MKALYLDSVLKLAPPIVLGKTIKKSKSGDHEVLKDWTIRRFYI